MPESIWTSRPADLYGRRDRDRLGTALWGVRRAVRRIRLGVAVDAVAGEAGAAHANRGDHQTRTRRPDVVALTLADPDGGLLPSWTPGGHIDVALPSGRRRQYSLCGPPGRRTDYRIAVRRIADGGGGSIEMHDAFDVGDTLVFEGPRNAFYLGTAEHDVLFVIGGIGVTPILPMIQVAQQRGINWRAIYAGRSREYMPFLDEVVSVAPDRVTVWADDEHGRVAAVDDLLAGAGPTTAVYVCGPDRHAGRGARGPRRTRRRATALRAVQPAAGGRRDSLRARTRAVAGECSTFRRIGRRWTSCSTAIRRPPYSCQQGFCGTCKVKVLAGQVDHRGRTAVGDDEMLVCVSRAKATGWSSTPESAAQTWALIDRVDSPVGHAAPGSGSRCSCGRRRGSCSSRRIRAPCRSFLRTTGSHHRKDRALRT